MRSILVALRFPPVQFSSEVFFVSKEPPSIELFRVCLVTLFHLAICLWASGMDVPMRTAEIKKMQDELWSERGIVVRLDFLNGERKMLTNFPEEVDGRLGVVVVVGSQNANACSPVNGSKLVKTLWNSSNARNKLYVELNGAPGNLEGSVRGFGARAIFLQ